MNTAGEAARDRADFAARFRRANERLAYAVSALLALTAALPVTDDADRIGVLSGALTVLILSVIWFRVVPPGAFGELRVMVFGLLAQSAVIVLLSQTGGVHSEYFSFALIIVTATIFSPRAAHTVVVAAATVASVLVVALVAPEAGPPSLIASVGTRILETAGFALVASLIGGTLRASRAAIAERADTLDDLRGRAEALALTDTLTGLYNRRFAADALERHIAEAQRGRTLSIATFDLDGFKRLNDSLGHVAGDDVLVKFARALRAGLRAADVAIRMGGDEFLVLLPGIGLTQANQVVERLRAAVRDAGWGAPDAAVTVSGGVAQWGEGQSAEDLLQSADRSLYIAKRAMRAAGDPTPR